MGVLSLCQGSQSLHSSYNPLFSSGSALLWVDVFVPVLVPPCRTLFVVQLSSILYFYFSYLLLLFSFISTSACHNTIWMNEWMNVNMSLTSQNTELKTTFTVCCTYWVGFVFPKECFIQTVKYTGTTVILPT